MVLQVGFTWETVKNMNFTFSGARMAFPVLGLLEFINFHKPPE